MSFQKKLPFLLLASILVAGVAVALEDKLQTSIKVGVLVPLTGEGASGYGDQVRNGVLLAESQSDSTPLLLIFEDSQCQAKTAITAARKLVEVDKVKAIIGDVCWTDLIAPITEKSGVVVISTGSSQSTVRGIGEYVFRLKLDVSIDSAGLARAIAGKLGMKTAAMMYAQDQWGEGIASGFRSEFAANGGTIVSEQGFQQGRTDFKAHLLKIKAASPELIMIGAYPAQVGLIAKQARELGLEQRLAAYRGGIADETIALGGAGVNGLIFLEEFDLNSENQSTQSFIAAFQKRYGITPNLFGAMGYDAHRLLSSGTKECGSDTACIRDYLESLRDFDGAAGSITFDSMHDVKKNLKLKEIQEGRFVDYNGTGKNL